MQEDRMQDDVIWMVMDAAEPEEEVVRGAKGPGNPFAEPGFAQGRRTERIPLPAAAVEQGMTELLQGVGRILKNAKQQAGEQNLELEEVELSVEISRQGQVSLAAFGGQVGRNGTMTLKFKVE